MHLDSVGLAFAFLPEQLISLLGVLLSHPLLLRRKVLRDGVMLGLLVGGGGVRVMRGFYVGVWGV